MAEALGDHRLVARLLGNLGNLSFNQGEFGQAHQYYHRQLAVAKNAGIRNSVAWVQMNLAQLQIRQGDLDQARRNLLESLVYWQEISSTVSVSFVLRGLAGLATALNQPRRALRLFVAAEALRQDVGRSLEPVEIANDEENLKEIRSQLSQNDFDAAWAEGLAMTIEDITAYALES